MTLRELRAAHYDRFHRQDWFDEEPFTDVDVAPPTFKLVGIRNPGETPRPSQGHLVHAVELAALFLAEPDHWLWAKYLWTADLDRKGQRVYVGGVCRENGHRFEVHRHLHLSDQWATPILLAA